MKIKDKAQFEAANVFGTGTPNTGFAQYFIGQSFLNPLTGSPPVHSLCSMSLLSRDVATTGTSTMPSLAAVSS